MLHELVTRDGTATRSKGLADKCNLASDYRYRIVPVVVQSYSLDKMSRFSSYGSH